MEEYMAIMLLQLFESANIPILQNYVYKEIATNYRHKNHTFFSKEKKIPQWLEDSLIFLFQSYHLFLRKLRRFKVILKLENQNTLLVHTKMITHNLCLNLIYLPKMSMK